MSSSFTPLRGVDCKSNTPNQLAPISWSLPTQEDSWYPLRKSNELWEWAETCLLRKPYIPLNVSSSKTIWFEWISQQNVRSRIGGCQKTTELWSSSSQLASYQDTHTNTTPTILSREHIETKDRVLPSHRSQTTGWEWMDFPLPLPRPEVSQHAVRCSSLAVCCSILTVPSRSYDDTSIKLMEIFLIYF